MSRRGLTPGEVGEGRRVFGDSIDWERVRVVEETGWPLALARAVARLQRLPPPAHNAVTLGHRVFFSRRLHTDNTEAAALRRSDLAWLIHELAHVWQFERLGIGALGQMVRPHLRQGVDPYDYGGAEGLSTDGAPKSLSTFTLEQQAEIARDYYYRLDSGEDTRRWEPLIQPLRRL
jgi:type VI secretion system secreted protein VgrG